MTAHKGGVGFEVIERDPNGIATAWLATCRCGERFTESTYEATEDKWRRHTHELTGVAPRPMGGTTNRWEPSA